MFGSHHLQAQTLAFPGAEGFGRFAQGARASATREVYIVTNLNDSGTGSFRDAVSKPGRVVVFAVGGIVNLASDVVVSPNVTIAGQTAPGDGIVFFNKRVTYSGASNSISRYLRIRLGATGNSGKDASGLSNGSNMIFDHMSITWGMDEVFSINWDSKGTAPDNITIQNSIIGQGLHRENHSAGGLIQTPDGGKVSLLKNLYISNKTRNPKVKGVNEFVNNVVYNWGNYGNTYGHSVSGDAYIMGGSSGVSEVNIINNYFVSGPLTLPSVSTPFSRGTGSFYLYGAGNYFDNNKNGALDGALVPYNATGYPGIEEGSFKSQPFAYPAANPAMTAAQAYEYIIQNVGASYPRRDQVDQLLIDEVASKGTQGMYAYRETDLPFTNGGLGEVFNAPAPLDTDKDGMPDAWEDAHGLNKNDKADAVAFSATQPEYLNIEVYINSLIETPPPAFVNAPTAITLTATSSELPAPNSQVIVKWKDNSDNEDHFVLERSENGTTFTVIAQAAANATAYTDNAGLVPNKTYYYRLQAVNATEASTYSTVASVLTPPIATAPALAASPSPANGYQYAELTNGALTVKWTGSSNTTKYEVYVGADPVSLTKRGEVAYVAAPSFSVTGLIENATYYWRINAVNAKGTTEGNVWSFRTTRNFPAGMVGHWGFDETADEGTLISDQSEYENHGVLGLDDDDQSIRVAGKVNGAIDFATASTNMYVVSIPHQDQLWLDKNSFAISFWMKAPVSLLPQDNNTSAYLLCKGSITRNAATGATGKRFDIEFKNKQIRFAIDDDSEALGGGKDELQADGTPFFTNEWVHVVVIRDVATNKLQLYRNGVFVKDQTITKAKFGIGEASALVVGNIGELEFLATTNQPAPYKGMLDELKLFNYSLTPQQVLELYHTEPTPIKPYEPSLANNELVEGFDKVSLSWKGGIKTNSYKLYAGTDKDNMAFIADVPLNAATYQLQDLDANTTYFWQVIAEGDGGTTTGDIWSFRTGNPKGMVGHWKLDETTGTVAADNSNFKHNGSLSGMSNAVWTADGKFGGGLNFGTPASTGAVVVPNASHVLLDQNSFTISMWVKMPGASSTIDTYLLHKGTFEATTGKWYGIQLKNGSMFFAIDDGITKTDVSVAVNGSNNFNLFKDTWKHIIAVRDTETKQLRIYIDGVLANSKADGTNTIGKSDALKIGNSPENKPYNKLMDDVRLYNYALSATEIQTLYSGSPLVAKAANPAPANGAAKVDAANMALNWTGQAQTYHLYTGTSADNLQLLASGLAAPAYALPESHDTPTYFWRVDAVRDGEVATGDVWSFTIEDVVKPLALAKDVTVTLAGGTASVTAQDVDNGSSDAFGIQSLVLSKTSFDCSNIGENEVTLTVTDNSGLVSTATATVTVVGAVPAPAIAVSRTDNTFTGGDGNTIFLGYGAQKVTLTASNATSAANATTYNWSLAAGLSDAAAANPVFTPVSAGIYTFVVTATNEFGCTATAEVTVTVIDPRCGKNLDKLVMCHFGEEICIEASSVAEHLAHGCRLGGCTADYVYTGVVKRAAQLEKTALTAYPNPVSETVTIAFTLVQDGSYTLEIYDLKGALVKVVATGKAEANKPFQHQLDASNYTSGVYLIKLLTEGEVITNRIIIQR